MIKTILLAATIASLLAAGPALADRRGDAQLSGPDNRSIASTHAQFTLPGGPWGQVTGALRGTPLFGSYVLDATLADGSSCRIGAGVFTRTSGRYPRVGRRTVHLPSQAPLRFDREARHGAIRWFVADGEAAGVQRMPAKLRSRRARWLTYSVTVATSSDASAACRKVASRTVRSIVRTLRLADGPPLSKAPFAAP